MHIAAFSSEGFDGDLPDEISSEEPIGNAEVDGPLGHQEKITMKVPAEDQENVVTIINNGDEPESAQYDSLSPEPISEANFSADERGMVSYLQMKFGLSRSCAAVLAIRRLAVVEGYLPEETDAEDISESGNSC